MKGLDLADLVALAAEVSEIEAPKMLELLDTPEIGSLLDEAPSLRRPHEAAATLMVGLIGLHPLPTGNRRLALLAALQLLAANGLDATLDPAPTRDLLAAVEAHRSDVAEVIAWLDTRVVARDPLDGALRAELSPDAWRAIGLALQRARRHRRHLVSPADLLLGLFREGTGPAAVALGAVPGGTEVVSLPIVPTDRPVFEPPTRKILELAFRARTTLAHRHVNGGHLLLGLLDGDHQEVLPDGLDPDDVRRRVLGLLGACRTRPPADELGARLHRLAARLRATDPEAADELDEITDLQHTGLDRVVEMIRAWRGEIFLESMARDDTALRVLGPSRLASEDARAVDRRRLVDKYLADIVRYPPLTQAAEAEVAAAINAETEVQATEARRQLVQSNLHLVVTIARKYEVSGLSMLDLIQEGNLGLMRAAERYDPTTGHRFSTFATWWIREAILAAITARP